MQTMEILDKLVVVQLQVKIWSGRKKLKPEDLGLDGETMPPEALVSFGSKKIFNPKKLNPFFTLKKRAEVILGEHGAKFLGGFAIPEISMESVEATLQEIQSEFQIELETFEHKFYEALEEWIEQFPEWRNIVSDALPTVTEVKEKIKFGWDTFYVVPAEESNSDLEETTQSLPEQVLQDVSKDAAHFYNRLNSDKKVTQKTLRTLRRMALKVENMGFMDNEVSELSDRLQDILGKMPTEGSIEGQDLALLREAVLLMANPNIIEMGSPEREEAEGKSLDQAGGDQARAGNSKREKKQKPRFKDAPPDWI